MKRGKNYTAALEKVDVTKEYSLPDCIRDHQREIAHITCAQDGLDIRIHNHAAAKEDQALIQLHEAT